MLEAKTLLWSNRKGRRMITGGDVRKWKEDGYKRQIDPVKDAEKILANQDVGVTVHIVQSVMHYCVDNSKGQHHEDFIRDVVSDYLCGVEEFRSYLEKDSNFKVMEEHIGFREMGQFWIMGDGELIPKALEKIKERIA